MSNQTFPVIYGQAHYLVDPNMLFNSSRKFAELVQPFGNEAPHCQLVILQHGFSERSISNFLKLVQGLPTDVQDNEMKEICEIAKMFKADQIYNTGLSFVQSSIDPSFYVPDTKYESGLTPMMLEHQAKQIHHDDLEFVSEDDSYDKTSESKQEDKSEKKVETVIYEIRIDRPALKCHRYHFFKNGEILYSAKKKGNKIVIGKGGDIHLKSSTVNHCVQITQEQMYNTIHIDGQTIILKYVVFEDSKAISMSITFKHKNDEQIYWFPKQPKLNPRTGGYALKLAGSHHHRPMNSCKNSVMKNSAGHTTFITRMMGTDFFEAECHPDISPALVFSIALSSIVGPTINSAGA